MNSSNSPVAVLSDADLLAEVQRLAATERGATVALIAALIEVDERRLYLGEGYSSLFVYCTRVLRLSEEAAYHRILAARTAKRYAVVLKRLADGDLTLTAVRLLAPHLTADNHLELLDEARHKSTREVEQLVARRVPRPDVPSSIRKLPAPGVAVMPAAAPAAADDRGASCAAHNRGASCLGHDPGASCVGHDREAGCAAKAGGHDGSLELSRVGSASSEPEEAAAAASSEAMRPAPIPSPVAPAIRPAARLAVVAPLAPERYKVQVTVSAETHAKLRRVQDLSRHTNPSGDLEVIFDQAVTMLLEHLERRKAKTLKPRKSQASEHRRTRRRTVPQGVDDRPATREGGNGAGAQGASIAGGAQGTVPTRERQPGEGASAQAGAREAKSPAGQPSSAGTRRTARRSRHIPASLKREVWARDQARCTFVGRAGRCGETGGLEFHHRQPFADGGEATVANVALLCRRHNHSEAERWSPTHERDADTPARPESRSATATAAGEAVRRESGPATATAGGEAVRRESRPATAAPRRDAVSGESPRATARGPVLHRTNSSRDELLL